MKKVRDTTVDYVRCIAIISIVCWHIMRCYFGNSIYGALHFVQTYSVPLFFLLSGYVADLTKSRIVDSGFLHFLKRKTETLLVPFLVWSLLIYQFIDNPEPPGSCCFFRGKYHMHLCFQNYMLLPLFGVYFIWKEIEMTNSVYFR